MATENDDRTEEIKKWFKAIVDDGDDIPAATVDHGMKKIECGREIHRKRRGSTPPWVYLVREKWPKMEANSTIRLIWIINY